MNSGEWCKLTAEGKRRDLDTISAVMSMIDSAIMIEDYSDFDVNGMYGELVDDEILNADRETVRVSVFVPSERNPAEALSFLRDRFSCLGTDVSLSASDIKEEDWAENWKKYYKPVRMGRITIVPAWEQYSPERGEITVLMDPGMAFGTGTHETTRLMIGMLSDYVREGERFLDVGTGSGILSICASKLGAAEAVACDIDPVAVKVAEENAAVNGCRNITCLVSDLLSAVESGEKFSFCAANIVADIIIRMLPSLSGVLRDGALVALSGIIGDRETDVAQALKNAGYRILETRHENDWAAILAQKPGCADKNSNAGV